MACDAIQTNASTFFELWSLELCVRLSLASCDFHNMRGPSLAEGPCNDGYSILPAEGRGGLGWFRAIMIEFRVERA